MAWLCPVYNFKLSVALVWRVSSGYTYDIDGENLDTCRCKRGHQEDVIQEAVQASQHF